MSVIQIQQFFAQQDTFDIVVHFVSVSVSTLMTQSLVASYGGHLSVNWICQIPLINMHMLINEPRICCYVFLIIRMPEINHVKTVIYSQFGFESARIGIKHIQNSF